MIKGRIRRVKKEDLIRIQDIIYSCSYIGLNQNKDIFRLRNHYTLKYLDKCIKNSDFFCFIHNKNVLGTGRLVGKEICTIYVDPKFHKKKIGSRMIKKLESFAKKKRIKKVSLHARPSAVGFYEKLGFSKKGKGHIMEKELK